MDKSSAAHRGGSGWRGKAPVVVTEEYLGTRRLAEGEVGVLWGELYGPATITLVEESTESELTVVTTYKFPRDGQFSPELRSKQNIFSTGSSRAGEKQVSLVADWDSGFAGRNATQKLMRLSR